MNSTCTGGCSRMPRTLSPVCRCGFASQCLLHLLSIWTWCLMITFASGEERWGRTKSHCGVFARVSSCLGWSHPTTLQAQTCSLLPFECSSEVTSLEPLITLLSPKEECLSCSLFWFVLGSPEHVMIPRAQHILERKETQELISTRMTGMGPAPPNLWPPLVIGASSPRFLWERWLRAEGRSVEAPHCSAPSGPRLQLSPDVCRPSSRGRPSSRPKGLPLLVSCLLSRFALSNVWCTVPAPDCVMGPDGELSCPSRGSSTSSEQEAAGQRPGP